MTNLEHKVKELPAPLRHQINELKDVIVALAERPVIGMVAFALASIEVDKQIGGKHGKMDAEGRKADGTQGDEGIVQRGGEEGRDVNLGLCNEGSGQGQQGKPGHEEEGQLRAQRGEGTKEVDPHEPAWKRFKKWLAPGPPSTTSC